MSKVIGIDISNETFDVGFYQNNHWINDDYENRKNGFKSLLKTIDRTDHCVMEASGPYYLPLAMFLHEQGIQVSVVNPLVIRRFAQMRLSRAKTDKKDAQLIAAYGIKEKPALWKPEPEQIIHLRQMFTFLKGIDKQIHMLQHQIHAFKASGVLHHKVKSSSESLIKTLRRNKEKIEREMAVLARQSYEQTISRLQSIPGIGEKTAILLTVITHDFQRFEHSRQLIAYVGLSPRVYQSGTSVRGKGHICKMGSGMVRSYLYMCSWSAKIYNKTCREMYDRLIAKGKPERVIKVAIANKLLKQAFALAKSNSYYNENYVPKPCF